MLFSHRLHGWHGCPQADGDYCWWLIADCYLSTDNTDNTDDTDSQDMGCAQIKSVESVESVGHEGCWGTLKPTDYTDDTDVRRRMGIDYDYWLLIIDYWWLMIDDWWYLSTDNTDDTDVRRRTGAFAWESVCAGLELSLVNGYVRNVCF